MDKPLEGPTVIPSSKDKISDLFNDWESDVHEVIEVSEFQHV